MQINKNFVHHVGDQPRLKLWNNSFYSSQSFLMMNIIKYSYLSCLDMRFMTHFLPNCLSVGELFKPQGMCGLSFCPYSWYRGAQAFLILCTEFHFNQRWMMDVFRNLPSSINLCVLSQHGCEKENIYLRTGDQLGKQKLCISRIFNHKKQIFEYMVTGLKLHRNLKCRFSVYGLRIFSFEFTCLASYRNISAKDIHYRPIYISIFLRT